MTTLTTTVSSKFHSEVITLTERMLDWIGRELRESADEAHDNETPSLSIAYNFLLENPECFGYEEWPADMPEVTPEVTPEVLQRAYGPVF